MLFAVKSMECSLCKATFGIKSEMRYVKRNFVVKSNISNESRYVHTDKSVVRFIPDFK